MYTSGSVLKLEYDPKYAEHIPEPRRCIRCDTPLQAYMETHTWDGIIHPSGIYTIKSLISPLSYMCSYCYDKVEK